MELPDRRREPGWDGFAKYVGGGLSKEDNKWVYSYRNLFCEAHIYFVSTSKWYWPPISGEDLHGRPHTQFRAYLKNNKGLKFKVSRPPLWRLLFSRFLKNRLKTSSREFNGLAEISSNEEVMALLVFSEPSLQDKIMDANRYLIYFEPLAGKELREYGAGVSKLVFEVPHYVSSMDELKSMNALFTQMIDQLLALEVIGPVPPIANVK